jgi:hypothetical protein
VQKTIWMSCQPITKLCFVDAKKHMSWGTTGVYFRSHQAAGCSKQEPTSFPPVRTHAVKLCGSTCSVCLLRDAPCKRLRVALKKNRRAARHEMRRIRPAQLQSLRPQCVDGRSHILGKTQAMMHKARVLDIS